MKRVIKNYVTHISKEDLIKLKKLLNRYNKCRNYFYTKYYKNIDIIFIANKYKLKTKQNFLVANNLLSKEEYSLLRYTPEITYKQALINALSDLKIVQQITFNKIQRIINRNNNLNKEEKKYLLYILKSHNLLKYILKGKKIKIKRYENLTDKQIQKLSNYLHKLLVKYAPKKPVAKSNIMIVNITKLKKDIDYSNKKLILYLTSLEKRKPIKLEMAIFNKQQFKGSSKLLLRENNKIELHKPINIKYKKIKYKTDNVNIIITAKHLIVTNTNNIYGENISNLIYKLQRKYNKKKYLSYDDYSHLKCEINRILNLFIKNEAPQKVTTLNLDRHFILTNNLKFSKFIINQLQKYIRNMLTYKLMVYKIKLVLVNEAYIDKACSKCLSLNTNTAAQSFECNQCTSHVSYFTNALNNITNYKKLGIGLTLPYSSVKKVLERRHNKIMSTSVSSKNS